MTVDSGRKATKQTKTKTGFLVFRPISCQNVYFGARKITLILLTSLILV